MTSFGGCAYYITFALVYAPAMPRRTKVGHPTLFEMEKPEGTEPTDKRHVDRPYSESGFLLGCSAFTAAGWPGTFYPNGMKPGEYLSFYSSKFQTVEIDSTFYGTPAASTVAGWYAKTPPDFIFAAKVPQVVTHEKVLVDCEAELKEFLDCMGLLKEKLGPLVLQFPRFDKYAFKTGNDFAERLRPFLSRLPKTSTFRFEVEIRNPAWLDENFLNTLREHNVALALTDTSFMPRPWELKPLDLLTSDFAYIRWLGNRKGIEAITTRWDKTIIDKTDDLRNWVKLFQQFVNDRQIR
jgi:uncharacterized protein YecE (DUF72 family)